MGSCCIEQPGLYFMGSSDLPTSGSEVAGTTGVSLCLAEIYTLLMEANLCENFIIKNKIQKGPRIYLQWCSLQHLLNKQYRHDLGCLPAETRQNRIHLHMRESLKKLLLKHSSVIVSRIQYTVNWKKGNNF